MQNRPLVSVVIPAYNRGKFLPRSIGSVLNQTYLNLELIIVDDRSTDNTEQLVKVFMEKDDRVKYVKNAHGHSCAGARNQGVEYAKGDYIAFLDSDDEWYVQHLEEALYYLTKYPEKVDLVTAKIIKKKESSDIGIEHGKFDIRKFGHQPLETAFLLNVDTLFDSAVRYALGSHITFVGKAEIFKKMRYDETVLIEDAILSMHIAFNKVKIAFIPKHHAIYWLHGSHSVNVAGNKNLEEQIRLNYEDVKLHNKILESFPLTAKQKKFINNRLADIYFWGIGYNYLRISDQKKAKEYFLKGLELRPFNLGYWKTFILRMILRYQKI